ncbi:MAG: cytochrome P450 [Lewinellaceae bacterium]|nr:cytochrome P450 [Lewinellaceae bacterium]
MNQPAPIPAIPRWRTLRNSFRFLRDPISLLAENVERFGHTYSMYMGGVFPAIFTADPGFIQYVLQKNNRNYRKSPAHFDKLSHFLGNGLLTSEGDFWRRQRRLIQPGFHRQRLAGLTGLMQTVIDEFAEELDQEIAEGPVDMAQHLLELAFNIVARSIFSTRLPDEDLRELSDNITILQQFIIRQIRQPFLNPWLKVSGQLREHEVLAAKTMATMRRYVRERQESGANPDDLLQMLLESRYEDTGEPMEEEQLLAELNILFVAGHETSANALAWTLYLLAQHPEYVDRLRQELAEVVGDRTPGFADLPRLELLSQVIDEGMRLYPPAWITDRVAIADDNYNGIPIPAGTFLVTYIYGAHHSPEHWDDPEAFRPERFAKEAMAGKHPYAYIPFGGGPRLCIGNNFALLEMQLAFAMLVRRYDFSVVPDRIPVPRPLLTLRPADGIWLGVKKRS